MLVPLTRPTLRRKDYNSVLDCLVTDQIAPGPLNQEFSAALSKLTGVSGGVGLVSYRSGIHCALELLELTEGDGVIISALAPLEYLQVLQSRGLEAMIVDVDPERPLPSIDSVQEQLLRGAKALVLYYTLGAIPASDELFQLGVPVIEDISQAAGGQWGGAACGARGQVTLLSLDPGAMITTGCGAAVLSRDRRRVKTLRGIAGDLYGDQLLPDMNAALGISQIRALPRFLQKRNEIGGVFREALLRSRHRPLFEQGQSIDSSFPILVKQGRPEVRRYAEKRGIQAEAAAKDAILAGEGTEAESAGTFSNAESLLRRCLLFPLYPSLSRKDVQLVCKVLSTLP